MPHGSTRSQCVPGLHEVESRLAPLSWSGNTFRRSPEKRAEVSAILCCAANASMKIADFESLCLLLRLPPVPLLAFLLLLPLPLLARWLVLCPEHARAAECWYVDGLTVATAESGPRSRLGGACLVVDAAASIPRPKKSSLERPDSRLARFFGISGVPQAPGSTPRAAARGQSPAGGGTPDGNRGWG